MGSTQHVLMDMRGKCITRFSAAMQEALEEASRQYAECFLTAEQCERMDNRINR